MLTPPASFASKSSCDEEEERRYKPIKVSLSHLKESSAAMGSLPHLPVAEGGAVLFLHVERSVGYNGPLGLGG